MIRYRCRDITRLLPGTARSMRRMEKITGRSDDMIILRGVNVYPTQIEEQVLASEGLAPYFQIKLTKDGRMDAMTILVETLDASYDEVMRQSLGRELALKIKTMIGVSAEIIVGAPETVPRSQGKAVRVVDKRGA